MINLANKCLFELKTILKFKQISIRSKLTLYKLMIGTPDIAVCVWNLINKKKKTEEQNLEKFERKVLWQILSLKEIKKITK